MQNIPKLYTAFAEWLSCLTIILIFRGLIDGEKKTQAFLKLAGSLVLLSAIHMFCGMVSGALWFMGMFAAVLSMAYTIKSILGLEWYAAAYCTGRAFMLAEFLASVEWQVYYFYFGSDSVGNPAFNVLFCVVIYAAGYGLFYLFETREIVESAEKRELSGTLKQLFFVWSIAVLFFILGNLSFFEVRTPFTSSAITEIFNIRTLMDLVGFLILEAFHIQKMDSDRKQEMAAIRNILLLQYSQYRESQENIDLLNRKYHDLKHQLQIVREERNDKKRTEYLDEIERGLQKYESEIKTGNQALDTILTAKSNYCLKYHITLTVVADGTLLNHLHVMDLCTIFGNALDNAIEYEVQIPDPECRLIHLSISEKNKFVCVVVENYYEGDLRLNGKLPATTKADKNYHGFGLKSIQYSVKKYDGYMNIDSRDEWFRLEMVFPEPSSRN